MRIKEFGIDYLYGKYSIKSKLDEEINIIVGNNGTFKSTLLGVIRMMITTNGIPYEYPVEGTMHDYEDAYISFDNNIVIQSSSSRSRRKKVGDINSTTFGYFNNTHVLKAFQENNELESFDNSVIKVDYVSTFDIKDTDVNTRETLLDKQLKQLQSDYGYYLNGLLKKFTGNLNAQGNVTKEDYNNIYARKILFENLVNEAFKETGKVIDKDADKLRFIIDDNTTIGADGLSSGEKQLLIILLTTLLEDGEEYILIMDEPEISLHISWQYKLIDMILELNPEVQIILTTHSPMIFADGWGDKAIHMEDITTNTRK